MKWFFNFFLIFYSVAVLSVFANLLAITEGNLEAVLITNAIFNVSILLALISVVSGLLTLDKE